MSDIFVRKGSPVRTAIERVDKTASSAEKFLKEKSPLSPMIKDKENPMGITVQKRDTILGN